MTTPVYLQCPVCAHRWLSAALHPWGDPTPERVAARCYCPVCDAPPPMSVTTDANPVGDEDGL